MFLPARLKVFNNFTRLFKQILTRAGIRDGRFHDLRSTALSKLLANGLSKFDLMNIAGHSKFETTEQFYLAVEDDLVGRARSAATQAFGEFLAPTFADSNAKGQQTQVLTGQSLNKRGRGDSNP